MDRATEVRDFRGSGVSWAGWHGNIKTSIAMEREIGRMEKERDGERALETNRLASCTLCSISINQGGHVDLSL